MTHVKLSFVAWSTFRIEGRRATGVGSLSLCDPCFLLVSYKLQSDKKTSHVPFPLVKAQAIAVGTHGDLLVVAPDP